MVKTPPSLPLMSQGQRRCCGHNILPQSPGHPTPFGPVFCSLLTTLTQATDCRFGMACSIHILSLTHTLREALIRASGMGDW